MPFTARTQSIASGSIRYGPGYGPIDINAPAHHHRHTGTHRRPPHHHKGHLGAGHHRHGHTGQHIQHHHHLHPHGIQHHHNHVRHIRHYRPGGGWSSGGDIQLTDAGQSTYGPGYGPTTEIIIGGSSTYATDDQNLPF